MKRRSLYGTRRWQRTRRAALERDDWKCRRCGAKVALEVHHNDRSIGRFFDVSNLESLCSPCHHREHGHHEPDANWSSLVRELLV